MVVNGGKPKYALRGELRKGSERDPRSTRFVRNLHRRMRPRSAGEATTSEPSSDIDPPATTSIATRGHEGGLRFPLRTLNSLLFQAMSIFSAGIPSVRSVPSRGIHAKNSLHSLQVGRPHPRKWSTLQLNITGIGKYNGTGRAAQVSQLDSSTRSHVPNLRMTD